MTCSHSHSIHLWSWLLETGPTSPGSCDTCNQVFNVTFIEAVNSCVYEPIPSVQETHPCCPLTHQPVQTRAKHEKAGAIDSTLDWNSVMHLYMYNIKNEINGLVYMTALSPQLQSPGHVASAASF